MHKKYFYITILTALALTLATLALNWVINPLSIFEGVNIERLNIDKPAARLNERLSKAYEVIRKNPTGVILGNSRALAFSEMHPGWSGKNNYNLALASGSMYEALRYFQHANHNKEVKEIVLSLTINMFLPGSGHSPQYDNRRLIVNIDGQLTNYRYSAYIKDIVTSTISFDATKASIKTIKNNKRSYKSIKNNKYAYTCKAPYEGHSRIKNQGGHARFFLQTNKTMLARNWPYPNAVNSRKSYYSKSIEHFIKLIRSAYKQNISLHIIIPPEHALLFETLYIADLWPLVENWKRTLININEQTALEFGKDAYSIWDFSGYNSITMESVPAWDDLETPMDWFWESLHFKESAANLILDRVFNTERENCAIPKDFGTKINTGNITTHINDMHNMHNSFKNRYPEHIRKLYRYSKTLGQ